LQFRDLGRFEALWVAGGAASGVVGEGGDAELGGVLPASLIELGEFVSGRGEADLEAVDFAEPGSIADSV
jgi:hypothetical protein